MSTDKQEVKNALMKRAKGYDYEEKKVIADKNGKPQKAEVYHKHRPPNIATIKEIVKEMLRGRW